LINSATEASQSSLLAFVELSSVVASLASIFSSVSIMHYS
jgi:hypothetical protein